MEALARRLACRPIAAGSTFRASDLSDRSRRIRRAAQSKAVMFGAKFKGRPRFLRGRARRLGGAAEIFHRAGLTFVGRDPQTIAPNSIRRGIMPGRPGVPAGVARRKTRAVRGRRLCRRAICTSKRRERTRAMFASTIGTGWSKAKVATALAV